MRAQEEVGSAPERAAAALAASRARGLLLLSCGLYGDVIRLHVPAGPDIVEAALGG